MHHELIIAISTGIAGMFGWGLADFFAKKTIDEIGDIASLLWAHIFGTIGFIVIVLFRLLLFNRSIEVPIEGSTWILLVFFGALQAIIYLLVYKAFAKGQVSLLNPVFASFSGIAVILSVIIFKEVINGHQIISLIVLFAGTMLLNIDNESLRSRRIGFIQIPGFHEIVLATVLAAVWTILWDKFIEGKDWLTLSVLMYAIMTLVIFVFARRKNIPLSCSKPVVWKYLVLIGICEAIAYSGISIGYSTTSYTSIIAVLSGAFSLPTIILARIFLKEKTTYLQAFASVIIIIGIITLSIFN